jgi:DNA-binding SARP family transcriptional activator
MSCSARDPDGALLTVPPGYLLSPNQVGTDLAEFDDLAARGMRAADGGEPATASALLGEALALWRGPAFGDVRSGTIRTAAEHLDSRRLLTAETKAETDLVLGRYATVVTELSGWLITHPRRERSLGLTMLALHRLGCRADALSLYQAMGQEPGPQPSAWLRSLYQRILADDDAPASVRAAGPVAAEPPALTTT